jgi:hypothetical protein
MTRCLKTSAWRALAIGSVKMIRHVTGGKVSPKEIADQDQRSDRLDPIRAQLALPLAKQITRLPAHRATEQGHEIPIFVDANIHALRLVKSTSSAL